jgi:hypothetical protein
MMKVIVCVALAMLTWIIGYYSNILPLPEPTFYQYTTLFLITIAQPLVIYSTIWKNYHSSSHLKEPTEIELTPKEIKITGESFYTVLLWPKIYKVVELKNWFLIYQNNLSAVIIPKKSFLTGEIEKFRQMLRSIPGLDIQLKEPKAA